MEGYSPSITDQPCRGPKESNGVRLVDQDVSADYEIKSFLGQKDSTDAGSKRICRNPAA
jgi:hypothetical protein